MRSGFKTRMTQREVFCEVVACIGDALGEMEVGRVRHARQALEQAMRWATLHPAFDEAVSPEAAEQIKSKGFA